jgi:protein required for attachment to host cells
MFGYLKSELEAAVEAKTQAEAEKTRVQSELDEIQRKIGYLTPRVRMKAGL